MRSLVFMAAWRCWQIARRRGRSLRAAEYIIGVDPAFIGCLRGVVRLDVIGEDGLVLQGRDRRVCVVRGWRRVLRLRASEQRYAGCEEQQV